MAFTGKTNLTKSDIYDDGCLRVEHTKFYVACDNEPLYNLTAKEFQILSRLVRELGRPIPQASIWAAAWGENTKFDDHAAKLLRVYMSTLRRKLKRFGLYILAKPTVGYILSTHECVCRGQNDGRTQ